MKEKISYGIVNRKNITSKITVSIIFIFTVIFILGNTSPAIIAPLVNSLLTQFI